MEQTNL